jgi:hypothetical protein
MILLAIIALIEGVYEAIFRHRFFTAFLMTIAGVYFIWFFFYYLPRKLRRLYQQWKYRLATECEIDNSAISIHNSLGNAKLPWDYFRRWRENKYLFILYPVDSFFHIFPKHCFSSEQDIVDFRKFAEEKFGQEK